MLIGKSVKKGLLAPPPFLIEFMKKKKMFGPTT